MGRRRACRTVPSAAVSRLKSNKPGVCDAFKTYATDIQYLYDVTRKGNLLHIVGYSVSEQNGDWTINRIFSGSLARMQAQSGLKYL